MILKKSVLEDVLARAMSTGADFAEVFAENTRSNAVRMIDSKVDEISDSTIAGVGIRAFDGLRCVSASTTDLTYGGLMRCAGQVADVLSEGKAQITIRSDGRRTHTPGYTSGEDCAGYGAEVAEDRDT